jgi:hypothetical protein
MLKIAEKPAGVQTGRLAMLLAVVRGASVDNSAVCNGQGARGAIEKRYSRLQADSSILLP